MNVKATEMSRTQVRSVQTNSVSYTASSLEGTFNTFSAG